MALQYTPPMPDVRAEGQAPGRARTTEGAGDESPTNPIWRAHGTPDPRRRGALIRVGARVGAHHPRRDQRPCDATLNAVDVRGVDSGNRDNDIKVSQHDRVPIVMTSAKGFRSHKIHLEFSGRRWAVSNNTDDGSTTSSDSVNVDDYATWGVGLYKVVGVATLSDGTTCTGAATVDVSGNPLATVAGLVAAGTVVAGTVGAAATGALGAGRLTGAGDAAADAFAREESARLGLPRPIHIRLPLCPVCPPGPLTCSGVFGRYR